METRHVTAIARELALPERQVAAVAALLAEDATVPFIARYRKEATGSLDEVAVMAVRDRLQQLVELDARRTAVLKSLEQHGHLTEELTQRVEGAATLADLEDLYLPYRPKRRTRAMIAREKGLEPLARLLLAQTGTAPLTAAGDYLNPEAGVLSADDALAGARDIIAEIVNEDAAARSVLRDMFGRKAVITSRVVAGAEDSGAKYRDYFEWQEPAASAPSHRILAMRRGEAEDVLNVTVLPAEADALALLESVFVRGQGEDSAQVRAAVHDSYRRLLGRSLETEMRVALKERADQEAIRVFAANLRELLLAPPLGRKRVLAVDPGFRTGCKAVCLDEQGKLLHHDTLFPHGSERQAAEAARAALDMAERFGSEIIAVGSGTAGRETEQFFRDIPFPRPIPIVRVDESGASVYSASEVAREEFGDLDLTVRGAVSIGRRLMDPLAELVKIDPKSIGVGQYQHDVDQSSPQTEPGRCRRELREQRRRRPEPGQQGTADLRVRAGAATGAQYRRPPQRQRPVPLARSAARRAAAGAQGVRAVRGVFAHPRRRAPPGRERRPPRELPGGRGHGLRPGLHGSASAGRCRVPIPDRYSPLRRSHRRACPLCRTSSRNSPSRGATRARGSSSSPLRRG